jgi:hypothetical protein
MKLNIPLYTPVLLVVSPLYRLCASCNGWQLRTQFPTISSLAEHTLNFFHHLLSLQWANFRVCSDSAQILTVFTWTSKHMLSKHGNDFIIGWAYTETISSQAEHMQKCLKVTGSWDLKDSISVKKVFKRISCLCTYNSEIIKRQNIVSGYLYLMA